MSKYPAAFMSYVWLDDQHENGRLTQFRERLSGEVRMQTGDEFHIFQDQKEIHWGQQWQQRVDSSLDAVTFLVPIITPAFFKSSACRDELERFLKREKDLGRDDLILPVYYVQCPLLGDKTKQEQDPLAKIIAARQFADWRELRFEPFTSPQIGKTFAKMAGQIVEALERGRLTPPPAAPDRPAPLAVIVSAKVENHGVSPGQKSTVAASVESAPRGTAPKTEPPTRIVDAFHPGHHATLTTALDAAKPGDRILVRPGLYQGGIVIDKAVEIIGDGELGEVVIEAHGNDVVLFKANMGRLANLTLRQTGEGTGYGVNITQGRLDLEGCDITSQGPACVAIHGGADPRLRRNRIHDGRESGVFVYENGQGTLEDNDIFANTKAGVEIKTGGNPTLRRNRIHDGKQNGVSVHEHGQGTLEDNDISTNAYSGIEIKTGGNPTIRRNRIHDAMQGGVFVNANGLGTLEDNDIFANAYSGVEIRSGGNPTIRRNRIHDGKSAGVLVHESGQGTLEDNDIFANARSGLEIGTGGSPTVRANRISKNGHAAIRVHAGGAGVFEDNDLRGNSRGAWNLKDDSKSTVQRARNQES